MAGLARTGLLPRPLRWLGISFAALLLTLLFALWIFPYERLASVISERTEALTGIQLELGDMSPTLGLSGFGLSAEPVRALLPQGGSILLDRVVVRPALSMSWLRGTPAVDVRIEGQKAGLIEAELELGDSGVANVDLDNVDLEILPLEQVAEGLYLQGFITGEIRLVRDEDGNPEGTISFDARDGSFAAPTLPMAVPFDTLVGNIELGGDHFARVKKLALDGPMLKTNSSGTVGRSPRRGAEPLRLVMQLEPVGDGLRPMLDELGVRIGPQGTARVQITGTLSKPTFRR